MADKQTKQSSTQRLFDAYNELALRERKILFFAVPATIIFVAVMSFIEPAFVEMQAIEKQISRVEAQASVLQQTKAELLDEAGKDPDEELKEDLARLYSRLVKANKDFDQELSQLVSPQAMPLLLEELFEQADSLTLLKMESIAPESIFSDPTNERMLFQHGIRIVFKGSYLNTRDFLASAEDLGWKLYWKHLNYQVDEHPLATTELEVFTLSTSEAFIGVN